MQQKPKNASCDEPIMWGSVNCFSRVEVQRIEYFNEQKTSTLINIDAFNSYLNVFGDDPGILVKSIVTYGAHGSGKYFKAQY